MHISTKISICFVFIMTVLLSVVFIVFNSNMKLLEEEARIANEEIPLMQYTENIAISMLTHRRYEKDLLINIGNRSKQEGYVSNFRKANTEMYALIDKIDGIIKGNNAMYGSLDEYIAPLKHNFSLYVLGIEDVASQIFSDPSLTPQAGNNLISQFKDYTYAVENTIEILRKRTDEIAQVNLKNSQEYAAVIKNIAITIIILALVLSIVILSITLRTITNPLKRVIAYAGELKNGNFDAEPNGKFIAEMENLISALRSMVKNLKKEIDHAVISTKNAEKAQKEALESKIISEEALIKAEKAKKEGMSDAANQLERVVESISSISTQINHTAIDSGYKVNTQAERIKAVSNVMESVNTNMYEIASNANTASDTSTSTRKKAEEGASVVQKALYSIQSVQSEAESLRQTMVTLGESANNITQILSVITDIADQTNLLALNAAIEAARAGESGRGFAVVADEVRKLAEKTMLSTSDVAQAITAIQNSAQESIKQMDTTASLVGEATILSEKSGIALHEIVSLIDTTSSQVHIIAESSKEQTQTNKDLLRTITEVNRLAEETRENMERTVGAVEELSAQSQSLSYIIDDLKNS